MELIEVVIMCVGCVLVLLLFYHQCRPNDPASRRKTVQIGCSDQRVSKEGVFWFYAMLIGTVLFLTIVKYLGGL